MKDIEARNKKSKENVLEILFFLIWEEIKSTKHKIDSIYV